jgi:hypothetical protein
MFEYNSEDAATAWPEGQYPATFLGAVDGVAKSSGQPMQTWAFEVFDDVKGRKQTIKEYVTAASLFKVRQFAAALNKAAEFKANKFFPEDHAGVSVMLDLKIEEASDGFDEKNKINKILARAPITPAEKILNAPPSRSRTSIVDKAHETVPADNGAALKNEDIPF